jgi:dolichol kinase
MWGISIFILWELIGDPWIAVTPAAFMAFGDGVTGIVRNVVFKKRTKHPIGNISMAILCLPMGYFLTGIGGLPIAGIYAGIAASIAERYEFGPIDDNILITLSSSVVLYLYFIII